MYYGRQGTTLRIRGRTRPSKNRDECEWCQSQYVRTRFDLTLYPKRLRPFGTLCQSGSLMKELRTTCEVYSWLTTSRYCLRWRSWLRRETSQSSIDMSE